jgi:hypothetical protein
LLILNPATLLLLFTIAVAVGWVLCIACHTVSRGATCASSRIRGELY